MIVYRTAATVNGFLADESHSLDWLFAVPGERPDHQRFIDAVTVMVVGASTYQWVLRAEDLIAQPAKWQTFFGSRPTYVFTHREPAVPPGADVRPVHGDVREVLDDITDAAGAGTVWVQGGGDLAGQFLDAGALDEVHVTIAPAMLAGGAPLLPRTIGPDRLRLDSAERIGQFVHLVFGVRPVR